MERKKIVHVIIACFYREGQGYQENILPKKHKQLGLDTYIIAWDSSIPNGKEYVNRDGIPVKLLPLNRSIVATTRGLRRIPHKRSIGLYEAIESITPDIIFVHGTDILDNREVIRYVTKHRGVRCYADQHADYFNTPIKGIIDQIRLRFVGRKTVNNLAKVSERIWGVTPWRVDYLHDIYGVSKEKLGLLTMGGDEDFIIGRKKNEVRNWIRKQYGISEDCFLIVTGGKIDRRKQQDLLMEAVSQMQEKNVSLLVFGTPDGEMETVVEKYKSIHNITFTGWLPSELSYDMYMASDLAFFPGTHSVLWEQAVSCGIPIVTRHWRGMEHVNVNGNAFFLDDVSIASIKEAINKCLDKGFYNVLSSKAIAVQYQFYYKEIAKKAIGYEE